jgi:hypothetical protein
MYNKTLDKERILILASELKFKQEIYRITQKRWFYQVLKKSSKREKHTTNYNREYSGLDWRLSIRCSKRAVKEKNIPQIITGNILD